MNKPFRLTVDSTGKLIIEKKVIQGSQKPQLRLVFD